MEVLVLFTSLQNIVILSIIVIVCAGVKSTNAPVCLCNFLDIFMLQIIDIYLVPATAGEVLFLADCVCSDVCYFVSQSAANQRACLCPTVQHLLSVLCMCC